jgi:hypothetical protein
MDGERKRKEIEKKHGDPFIFLLGRNFDQNLNEKERRVEKV